jgi:hypothetical protein
LGGIVVSFQVLAVAVTHRHRVDHQQALFGLDHDHLEQRAGLIAAEKHEPVRPKRRAGWRRLTQDRRRGPRDIAAALATDAVLRGDRAHLISTNLFMSDIMWRDKIAGPAPWCRSAQWSRMSRSQLIGPADVAAARAGSRRPDTRGFAPLDAGREDRRWAVLGSNQRPPACKAGALTS